MKTITTTLILSVYLPSILAAQPTVTNNEFYHIGDVYQMVTCDFPSTGIGGSGAAQVWDFSLLSSNGTAQITAEHDTAAAFSTSNTLISMPGGKKEHAAVSSSDTYINGIEKPGTPVAECNNYDDSKRPFTYMQTYVDTYRINMPTATTGGTGYIVATGDAYGTLKLPNGTFSNVLRIRKQRHEKDTIATPSTTSTTDVISYMWFDSAHTAPLFEVDSITSDLSGSSQTAMYQAVTEGVRSVSREQNNYTGHLDDNGLLVTGTFEYGKVYEVTLINLIGRSVLEKEFEAAGATQRFSLSEPLAAGIYIISVTSKDDPSVRATIKVVKNY